VNTALGILRFRCPTGQGYDSELGAPPPQHCLCTCVRCAVRQSRAGIELRTPLAHVTRSHRRGSTKSDAALSWLMLRPTWSWPRSGPVQVRAREFARLYCVRSLRVQAPQVLGQAEVGWSDGGSGCWFDCEWPFLSTEYGVHTRLLCMSRTGITLVSTHVANGCECHASTARVSFGAFRRFAAGAAPRSSPCWSRRVASAETLPSTLQNQLHLSSRTRSILCRRPTTCMRNLPVHPTQPSGRAVHVIRGSPWQSSHATCRMGRVTARCVCMYIDR
jgi:hypothetical protein